ncbi:heparan-alpha-glucosaminide N-acetyltransferase domain-containing protein [Actinobaculum sp. 313]|uniref:heparan-alpha-glucosaminide N-acetyltransferase domain-containing protein n=1 Tax=Actinobaculum sp. 313 TaxID=2495645 RepID=UPI000D52740E|nr:heparan-alpha-glucosaminide N-acetyltransferase domain-containing protein [Actinobaculum sp. 313]AWE43348.1 hypothetical protein DDD63_00415 [Actinobaculum sp. 313]
MSHTESPRHPGEDTSRGSVDTAASSAVTVDSTTATPTPPPGQPTIPTPTPGPPTANSLGTAVQRYTGRIGGLDIARALAILGMYYAHTAPLVDSGNTLVNVIAAIPHGRSSILFALLAGISLAILTGRNVPYTGERMRTARLRIFGRACALLLITGILSLLGTSIALILSFYAAWFVCSLPFSRWSAKRLFIAAGVVALAGPPLGTVVNWLLQSLNLFGYDSNYFTIEVFITGLYPGLTYMAFILAGMGIGRLDITRRRLHGILIGVGCLLMAVGYGAAGSSPTPWWTSPPHHGVSTHPKVRARFSAETLPTSISRTSVLTTSTSGTGASTTPTSHCSAPTTSPCIGSPYRFLPRRNSWLQNHILRPCLKRSVQAASR